MDARPPAARITGPLPRVGSGPAPFQQARAVRAASRSL